MYGPVLLDGAGYASGWCCKSAVFLLRQPRWRNDSRDGSEYIWPHWPPVVLMFFFFSVYHEFLLLTGAVVFCSILYFIIG